MRDDIQCMREITFVPSTINFRIRNHPEKFVRLSLMFFHVAGHSGFRQRSGLNSRSVHDIVQIPRTNVLVSQFSKSVSLYVPLDWRKLECNISFY